MPVATVSDDDRLKKSSPPPPAAHCRRTPTVSTVSTASVSEEPKPLDLSIKPTEQPLNLCSKRKRSTPVSLSKRNHTSVPLTSALATTTTTTAAAAAAAAAASSMFIPFYALSPFFDPNGGNQQELLQQFQTLYSQLQLQQQHQQQQQKLPKAE